MEIKIQKICAEIFFLAMMIVWLLPVQAHAAEKNCTISIPVETTVSGESAPAGTAFELVLEAADTDCPMPEKTEITIKDSGKASFGPITYTVPEDYQYRVYQKIGTAKNFTYDKTQYTVTVRVINAEDGGLSAEIWAIKDGTQNKVDKILFTNKYTAPETPKTPTDPAKPIVKTGDNAQFYVWGGILAAALVMMAVLFVIKRNRDRKIENK